MSIQHTNEKLDQFVLDIEFLLISVVQGVALAGLATSAVIPLTNLQFEYFPYIFSAFILILAFWSGAIVHSLSFIDWPLDLTHNFLYFLAAFVEVMAFSQIMNPLNWFGLIFIFFVVIGILYMVDLNLIKKHEDNFMATESKKKLFNHIKKEQVFELKYLISSGILFNLVIFILIFNNPQIFIENKAHLPIAIAEALFLLGFLINSVHSFKKRAKLITESISK